MTYVTSPMAAHLRDLGIEVKTQADQIEGVLGLERNLNLLFAAVAAVSAVGLVGALTASMVAGVDRKRRSMAVLALLGFSQRSIMLFPVIQASLIGMVGAIASLIITGLGAVGINTYFAPVLRVGQVAARLEVEHIGVAVVIVAMLINSPAAIAARRAADIDPAEASVRFDSRPAMRLLKRAATLLPLISSAGSIDAAATEIAWKEQYYNPKPQAKISCCRCHAVAP